MATDLQLPLKKYLLFFILAVVISGGTWGQSSKKQPSQKGDFKVIGFFTAKNDLAHISFVHEANRWLAEAGKKHGFVYDSTSNWDNLNLPFLADYQVVLFLDTRPEAEAQRAAFQQYMEQGGGWLGFHFSAFALTPSTYPQNWDWYHEKFLGSGEYKSNTWRPHPGHSESGNQKASRCQKRTDYVSGRSE